MKLKSLSQLLRFDGSRCRSRAIGWMVCGRTTSAAVTFVLCSVLSVSVDVWNYSLAVV